ncbi:MAG TPA: CBS domain-containing protein [Longimicrobiales bacterium]|nr:CBS domain-containing protein [Longimicrobiales bacterium]
MQLLELLPRAHIVAPLRADTLRTALSELVAALAANDAIRDVAAVERGLNGPRARDIVAAGPDVVLPHYRTNAVDRLVVALGIAPAGLDARDLGLDHRPRIVAVILAPTEAATLYLQAVAALARLFQDRSVVERMTAATSADDVLRAADLAGMKLQPRLTVRDIMTHSGQSVTPATTVRDAVDLMVRRRLRALPVVGEKQEVLGIISEWDIMRGLLPQIPRAGQTAPAESPADTLRVKDIMTRSVLCISEELGLEEAANMMINKDVEQFPVTREGKLTGFLTRSDIIRKLFGR